MNDVDEMLSTLRGAALPAALDAIEAPVMAGLALVRERSADRRAGRARLALAGAVAAVVGLGGGLWGGVSGPSHVAAGARDRALLAVPAAAPSHLLEA